MQQRAKCVRWKHLLLQMTKAKSVTSGTHLLLFYPKVALNNPGHPHHPSSPCSGAAQALLRHCSGHDQRNRQTRFRRVGSALRFEWQLFARSKFLGYRWPKTRTPHPNQTPFRSSPSPQSYIKPSLYPPLSLHSQVSIPVFLIYKSR